MVLDNTYLSRAARSHVLAAYDWRVNLAPFGSLLGNDAPMPPRMPALQAT